jgi:hypothetical protein
VDMWLTSHARLLCIHLEFKKSAKACKKKTLVYVCMVHKGRGK